MCWKARRAGWPTPAAQTSVVNQTSGCETTPARLIASRISSEAANSRARPRSRLHSESSLSSPTPEQLAAWRVFFECAYALIDILDSELQAEGPITLRWYDVLVHLEEAEDGLRMGELADRILFSKSGFTRVIDRMEEAALVRRERPADDRRVVKVFITPEGSTRSTPRVPCTAAASTNTSCSTSASAIWRRSGAPSKGSATTYGHCVPAASAGSGRACPTLSIGRRLLSRLK